MYFEELLRLKSLVLVPLAIVEFDSVDEKSKEVDVGMPAAVATVEPMLRSSVIAGRYQSLKPPSTKLLQASAAGCLPPPSAILYWTRFTVFCGPSVCDCTSAPRVPVTPQVISP